MPNRKDIPNKISFVYGVFFILFLIGLLVGVYFIETDLPKALTLQDEIDNPNTFITQNAKNYLKGLVDMGPRVVGSYENEIEAVKYLKNIINNIVKDRNPQQNIEVDLQLTQGSYYLGYKPYGSINAYANLQNVVVKLHGNGESNKSVLINAHFDTMTTSPGGSDDGINCAIMLEILRILSLRSSPPLHNIIFLFNGGEESNIQASHGFITQHEWAEEIAVVINLEATGAGGKEILFQAGPEKSWLMKYYSKVPYPFSHVAGEEIFKSNIIPSDSDFRIFRDFGGLIGYDFAYIKNGYRYHTKYDDFTNINDGVYQRSGDNILSLVTSLSEAEEISLQEKTDGQNDQGAVFFDVFGLFVIYYKKTFKCYILTFLKFIEILIEWLLSAAFILLIGLILGAIGNTMSWYKVPYLAIGLYSMLTLIISCSVLLITNKYLRKDSTPIQDDVILHSHLTRTIWTIVVLIGVCFGVRAVYLLIIPIIFNMITLWIIHGLKLHRKSSWWVSIYIIGNIFPTMFLYGISFHILALFIPICGRFGTEMNPELLIGLFTMMLTILCLCYYIPLILLTKGSINIVLCLLCCFIASFILALTPVGFPYSGDLDELAPQRFSIYHTQRIIHNENDEIIKSDAGFHFIPMDYNSPETIKKYVKEMEDIVSLENDCKKFLFCGLPVTYSRDFEELDKSIWIPTKPPIYPSDLPKMVHSKRNLNSTVVRYEFIISGPDCMDVYLSPKLGIQFLETNLNDFIPNEQPLWNGRPTLYILYVYGKEPALLQFYVDFLVPNEWNEKVLDVAVTGKYLHDKINPQTDHYKRFLDQFPDFAAINTQALGYYESWII
nr:endoplasmic reticulum metallopeptidase 1-like [Onthophagus taurus]